MFGDILGNLEEKQKKIKAKLAEHPIKIEMENGSLVIEGNAAKVIENVSIDPKLIMEQGTEGVEDLMVVGYNKFIEEASKIEKKLMEGMISDVLPGMGNLGNLFS